MVISCPSYFGAAERQALKNAADIAGINVPKIVDESTALAVQYGFFQKQPDLRVAFIDFGESKTTITIAQYTRTAAKILCHKSDRNLGARNWDYKIFEKICNEFKKQNDGKSPVETNKKCVAQILDTAE